jgi:hypothetical protein
LGSALGRLREMLTLQPSVCPGCGLDLYPGGLLTAPPRDYLAPACALHFELIAAPGRVQLLRPGAQSYASFAGPGSVYLVHFPRFRAIKVGFSRKPGRRLMALWRLRGGLEVLFVLDGAGSALEAALHAGLEPWRIHGLEHYRPTCALLALARDVSDTLQDFCRNE